MTDLPPPSGLFSDARLAACATSGMAAWVWSADGTRVLWANPVGAAVVAAPTAGTLAQRRFEPDDPAARQIGGIFASLTDGAAPRLARLRGFGGALGRALTCLCSRIACDGQSGVLVVANEPIGPALNLAERVRRLFVDHAEDVAAFAPDGALLMANAGARRRLGRAETLTAVGGEDLAARALADGAASGTLANGPVHLARLGCDQNVVLVMTFRGREGADRSQAPAVPATAHATNPLAGETVAESISPPPVATPAPTAPSVPPLRIDVPLPDLRHPLRFVWQMDADGRFTLGSDGFMEILGPRIASALGRTWADIAAALALDPEGQVQRAVETRDTWSGIKLAWPIEGSDERLTIELSGLPLYDRNRVFRGYRGFGVCRDTERLARLVALRQAATAAPILPDAAAPPPQASMQPAASPVVGSENVVRFPGPPLEARLPNAEQGLIPALSPVERSAFREIARQLSARLQIDEETPREPEPATGPPPARPAPAAQGYEEDADRPAPGRLAGVRRESPNAVLDPLPIGILIYRFDQLLYANRAFLDAVGYTSLDELRGAGGLDCLFVESRADLDSDTPGRPLSISTPRSGAAAVAGRLLSTTWNGESAMMILQNTAAPRTEAPARERETLEQTQQTEQLQHDIRTTRGALEKATAAKAELLAKISHGVRTPLNSIIGFSEVMLEERFGPIGNERYRRYIEDIRASGAHVLALVNDMLELSRMEAGQIELTFADVDLNDIVQDCIAAMQPEAGRERIIMRTSLAPNLPAIAADVHSVRQIIVNMLTSVIKLTGPGGQVIVSTGRSGARGVVLRVRHTGPGMSESEVKTALEPFRQPGVSARPSGGSGLGLPLSRALAEANRGTFAVSRRVKDGTLVEVAFQPAAAE
jgi:signal transduction histidine kinase